MLSNPLQIYIFCSLLPFFAFAYLIYNFYFMSKRTSQLENSEMEIYDHMISNIQGVICATNLDQWSLKQSTNDNKSYREKKACKQSLVSEATDCCTQCVSNKKNKYLPHSADGISNMKHINKIFIVQRKNQLTLVLKIKKKKILSNYSIKHGYHKTVLPIIFEEVQY